MDVVEEGMEQETKIKEGGRKCQVEMEQDQKEKAREPEEV